MRNLLRAQKCPNQAGLCKILIVFALALIQSPVYAHKPEQSYLFLSIFDRSIEVRVEIPLTDLNKALDLNFRTDLSATQEELDIHIEKIKHYAMDRVTIHPNGDASSLHFTGHRLFSVSFAQYAVLEFSVEGFSQAPEFVDIGYGVLFDKNPDHRGLLVIENNWKTSTFNNEAGVSLIFDPAMQNQRLDLASGSMWSGFLGMIQLGAHHIAIGIDHILFIVALLLPSVLQREKGHWVAVKTFRIALIQLAKTITIFTLAHSITLSLAALDLVQVSSRFVESVIALSIILVGLQILFPIFIDKIWWVVFAFGLFHGFGFADVLSSMGIHSSYLGWSLLGFNLGVEFGQLLVVCTLFPLLYWLRIYPFYIRLVVPFCVCILVTIAAYWFIERAFKIDLPAGEMLNNLMAWGGKLVNGI